MVLANCIPERKADEFLAENLREALWPEPAVEGLVRLCRGGRAPDRSSIGCYRWAVRPEPGQVAQFDRSPTGPGNSVLCATARFAAAHERTR